MPPELWSERKTADHFGVSLPTLRRWVRLKEIGCVPNQADQCQNILINMVLLGF